MECGKANIVRLSAPIGEPQKCVHVVKLRATTGCVSFLSHLLSKTARPLHGKIDILYFKQSTWFSRQFLRNLLGFQDLLFTVFSKLNCAQVESTYRYFKVSNKHSSYIFFKHIKCWTHMIRTCCPIKIKFYLTLTMWGVSILVTNHLQNGEKALPE